jgi:hypothetical protein
MNKILLGVIFVSFTLLNGCGKKYNRILLEMQVTEDYNAALEKLVPPTKVRCTKVVLAEGASPNSFVGFATLTDGSISKIKSTYDKNGEATFDVSPMQNPRR